MRSDWRKMLLLLAAVMVPAMSLRARQQNLPDAPSARSAPPPQAPPRQTPEQPQEPPAPAVFEDLSPHKPAPPAPRPASESVTQTQTPDPVPAAQTEAQPSVPAAAPQSAQPAAPGAQKSNDVQVEEEPQATFRAEAREVDVVFTVEDKHGHFVRNLTQNDITVLDNNMPPEKITGFSAQTGLPLRVGLLIDASSSIRERFKFEQDAAAEFLASIIRPKRDEAFVVGFDNSHEVVQDFTNDTGLLAKGVHLLRPGGGTALYDAVYAACRRKLWHTKDKEPVRKAIILVSDGDDNQSVLTLHQAVEMAQRAEVIIYAISTNNSGSYQKGDKILGQMAEATGGRAFYPLQLQDVSNAFADVQEELRSQYSIAYVPQNFARDGSYHSIEIKVKEKKLHARARKGYFAQASASPAPAEGK